MPRVVKLTLLACAALLVLVAVLSVLKYFGRPTLRPPVGTDPLAQEAEYFIIRYLESKKSAQLRDAEKALKFLLADQPHLTYGHFLKAFAHRLDGRLEAEKEVISRLRPENRAAYAYFFMRPMPEVIASLRCNYINSCLMRKSPQDTFLDPFHHVKDAKQPLKCKGVNLDPASCPEDWDLLGRFSWSSLGEERLSQWLPYKGTISLEEFFSELGLKKGMSVVDVGAGTGYFTFPMARYVGPKGKVYATEIEKKLTDFLNFTVKYLKTDNVDIILTSPGEIGLPEKLLDVVFLCEILQAIIEAPISPDGGFLEVELNKFLGNCYKALKPGGTLVITEYASAFEAYRTADGASLILSAAEQVGFSKKESLPIFDHYAVWLLQRPGSL